MHRNTIFAFSGTLGIKSRRTIQTKLLSTSLMKIQARIEDDDRADCCPERRFPKQNILSLTRLHQRNKRAKDKEEDSFWEGM